MIVLIMLQVLKYGILRSLSMIYLKTSLWNKKLKYHKVRNTQIVFNSSAKRVPDTCNLPNVSCHLNDTTNVLKISKSPFFIPFDEW